MRTLIWGLAWSLSVLVAPAAMAQDRGLAIEYTVKVADIPGQLFHVTTDIRNINQPSLELSLPVWSPGWYVIENYAKNVFRFRVTEPDGRELRPAQVRKQTWRIDTKGISRVTVEFDYLANVLSANQARIAPDYAFFTGTQLFLLPEGHRSRPSVVRFDVPSGWRIASGLDETADPMVFTAPEYDTLVDQPTLMGQFDVTRFTVDGKPHDLVANPAGVFSAEKTRTLDRPPHEAGGNAGQDLRRPAVSEIRLLLFLPARGSECRGAGAPELVRRPLEPRRAAAARRHGGAGRARVLSRLERQAHPSGADVALRLRAGERDAAAVGVRGLHDVLQQPGGVSRRVKGRPELRRRGREGDRGSRGQRGTALHIGVGLVHVHVDRLCHSASVQHFLLLTGAEPRRTPGPLHSSRHQRRIGSGRRHADALHGLLPARPRIQHRGFDSRRQPNHQEVVRKLLQPVRLGHRRSALRDDFRLRRLSGRTRHTKDSLSGCEPGHDGPGHRRASRLRCRERPVCSRGTSS